ncbi:sigma-54-dependent transcriptional regulator [Natronoflexus pectinivorans]|uniref:DNA-binding NtrC family response regulator n=1 Tax=Natronoflexus pectinivorans TaxID=682526 RepID=A0A4R2GIB9_9BACT|nr:sigma-54 dependent transcriptional regulator [Natronoflexus pectinivorans]TCO07950.1 DNA-binding NtrC family response regulator [Natronoflexus pectinivorans]
MKVFVVEDDPLFRKIIERTLKSNEDVEVVMFSNGSDFLRQLADLPDVVTLDLGLPDFSGEDVFNQIVRFNPNIRVIIISGKDDIRTAVELLKQGAYDYITKDESTRGRLQKAIDNIFSQLNLQKELSFFKNQVAQKYDYQHAIIGESKAIKEVSALVDKALKIPNINVSIRGEAGTGKELMAKIIHYNSNRRERPFVSLNLTTLPPDMIEGELFGYEQAGINGNVVMRPGKIEEANEGTIYLEEIQEMGEEVQLRLLNLLQHGFMQRVGGTKKFQVNVRVISASCVDLSEMVREQTFREDLYFRLMGLPVVLPSLKERQKDILLLADYFLKQFCHQNGISEREIASKARRKLLSYSFPGNVRELKAIIELAAVLSNNGKIEEEDIVFNSVNEVPDILTEEMTLREYNEKIIRYYLDKYGNVMKVAEKLEIGKSTIYNLLKDKEL